MPSGYENSPDYGGPEPTLRGFVLTIITLVAIAVFVMLAAGVF
jgi:hypothetical protein